MNSDEIQAVSELIAFHPPIVIGALCLFMYVRGRILYRKAQDDVVID